mgnify:CR=1 FL=1
MNEKTSNGTSGQNVPKSKFRHKSRQEQAAESKLRMEKRGEKLDKARGKLAKQKPPKRPGPVKRAGRAALGGVHGFVHGKIYEVEHENVGTEGAHRSELVGESVLRHGTRHVKKTIREHPAKAVQRAESKYIKLRRTISTGRRLWSILSWTRGPFPGICKSGVSKSSMRNRRGRPQSKGPRPLRKRLSPRKSWRPGRWLSSSGIPWAWSSVWPAPC